MITQTKSEVSNIEELTQKLHRN